MAEMIHRSQASFIGPWLFDSAVMASLDAVVKEQWEQLEKNKKRLIENAIRREKYQAERDGRYQNVTDEQARELDRRIRREAENNPDFAGDGCLFTLTLASDHKVRDSTIRGAAEHTECQTQHVRKLELAMVCGGVKVNLVVPATKEKKDLQIVTFPEGSEEAKECFVKLSIWAENHRPGWLRVLNGAPPPAIVALFAVLVILPLFLVATIVKPSKKPHLRDEAKELVATGVTQEDHSKAISILLRKSFDLDSNEVPISEMPLWSWVASVLLVSPVIMLIITATTAFEIGKGKFSVSWQKLQSTILRKWLPSFIIMGIVASVVGSIIYDGLKK